MWIDRMNQPYRRALETNYATNGYPTTVPTITPPATGADTGIFYPSGQPVAVTSGPNQSPALIAPQTLHAVFFGQGAENATFSARLYGFKQTIGIDALCLWVPVPLFEVTCTLSTAVGVADADVTDDDKFVDTITLASGFGTTDINGVLVTSPTGNIIAHVLCGSHGFGAYKWAFTTGGSATNCNCLYCVC